MADSMRRQQAGCIIGNWALITVMLHNNHRDSTANGTLNIFGEHLPFYGMLSNNLSAVK